MSQRVVNMKTIATIALILLVGFFGYAQETSVNEINNNKVSVINQSTTNTKSEKEVNPTGVKLEIKRDINIKETTKEVAIRFQERWLKVTLVA